MDTRQIATALSRAQIEALAGRDIEEGWTLDHDQEIRRQLHELGYAIERVKGMPEEFLAAQALDDLRVTLGYISIERRLVLFSQLETMCGDETIDLIKALIECPGDDIPADAAALILGTLRLLCRRALLSELFGPANVDRIRALLVTG